jgi:hypothetical protein
VDEYCDLTLDKMVEQYKAKKDGASPLVTTEIPKNGDDLVAILKTYKIEEKRGNSYVTFNDAEGQSFPIPVSSYKAEGEKKPGFFEKVRSIFKK